MRSGNRRVAREYAEIAVMAANKPPIRAVTVLRRTSSRAAAEPPTYTSTRCPSRNEDGGLSDHVVPSQIQPAKSVSAPKKTRSEIPSSTVPRRASASAVTQRNASAVQPHEVGKYPPAA